MPNGRPSLLSGTNMTRTTSSAIRPTGTRRTVCRCSLSSSPVSCIPPDESDTDTLVEKAEWPLSRNAAFETPVDPTQPFDYNAVPETFYFDCEAVGSVPMRSVVEHGLDILVTNLAKVIEGVDIETGGGDDDDDGVDEGQGGYAGGGGGLVEPNMPNGGGDYYGDQGQGGYYQGAGGAYGGGGGSGMSPLRR